MAVVVPFAVHAPPVPAFVDTAAPPHLLALSAGDREALLAALEMALAVCRGEVGAALCLAGCYPEALAHRLDRLADRAFLLGQSRPQTVDIPRSLPYPVR